MEKKRFLFRNMIVLMCLLMFASYSHAQTSISYGNMTSDITWENIGKTPMTGMTNDGIFQFIAEKGASASSYPTVNNSGNDVRVYANSTLTLKNVNNDNEVI